MTPFGTARPLLASPYGNGLIFSRRAERLRAMYVMTIPMANELLSILQTEMTGKGAQKH